MWNIYYVMLAFQVFEFMNFCITDKYHTVCIFHLALLITIHVKEFHWLMECTYKFITPFNKIS